MKDLDLGLDEEHSRLMQEELKNYPCSGCGKPWAGYEDAWFSFERDEETRKIQIAPRWTCNHCTKEHAKRNPTAQKSED